jgi:hypothetical protein
MKTDLPKLSEMQEVARAKRSQRSADIAARRPVSPLPERVYMMADDRKKFARDKRERKRCQRWDLARRCKRNPLAERCTSD